MPIEKIPSSPLPMNYAPPESVPYKVKDGDSWLSIAQANKTDAASLIFFNFKTKDPDEVNWYLRRNVGCRKQTFDRKNWIFSSAASPGLIYLPQKITVVAPKDAPVKDCPDELTGANETLRKSQETADTIIGAGATSDMPYWFARLYQYITLYEIQDKDKLDYPCFLLHFIPVFYDSYLVAADAFKKKAAVPSHWADHFNLAGLVVTPTELLPYANAVSKSLALGVAAHIKGDMAPSLASAYRSFSTKYKGVPLFDTYKRDFFEHNRPVFDKVKLVLVNELVNRGLGLAAFGKSVNPDFAARAAEAVNMGLNIDEIYKWREEAWATAKKELKQ